VKVHEQPRTRPRTAGGRHYPVPGGMLETAENLRRQYASRARTGRTRDDLSSTGGPAQKDGILAEEDRCGPVRTRQGEELIDTDEHPTRRHVGRFV